MQSNAVLTSIEEGITPYIGQMMARSSVALYAKRLGIDNGTVEVAQLDQLLRHLSLGLNIFIGRDKTEGVIREIRSSIGGRS